MGIEVLSTREQPQSASSSPSDESVMKAEEEISLLDLSIVVAERKWTVIWVTVTVTVLAVIVSLVLPIRYTASTSILPPQQNSSTGAAALASQLGNMGGLAALAGSNMSIKNPNDQLVSMMKSRTVEDSMIERFGLMQEYHTRFKIDARKVLERRADIDGSGKDGMIHISIEDKDPRRAAELANGYVDQFRELTEHLAITEAGQRRLFFEQQLQGAKDNLANAEVALEQTQQKTGLIQLDSQTRALIESAVSLRAQIAAKEVEIQSLGTFATDQNAQLVLAQQELESLRAQLAKLGGPESNPETSLIVTRGEVSQAGLEYIRRVRDVKYYETIFELLARQYEMAKLDEAKEGSVIQVVDPAVAPELRSFPKRGIIVMLSCAAGFLLGIIIVLVQGALRHLKQYPDTEKKLHLLRRRLSFRKATA